MATYVLAKTARTVVSSASNSAGSTTRGTLDMRTVMGGLLTAKITNGGTGPTLPCECRVLVAHDGGTTPTAGSEGSTWKTLAVLGNGGSTNSAVTTFSFRVPAAVMHLEVEFTGNTGQAVTVEAFVSELSNASS